MKYTKKMKLVECKDDEQTIQPKKNDILDSVFVQPKTLQNLDSSMSEILFNKNLNDNQKWTLYNQILHRYLYFTKQYNPQYMTGVKAPADYSMYLDETSQRLNVPSTIDREIRYEPNTTQSSLNTTNISTQPTLNNNSMHAINDASSLNTTLNNSLPTTTFDTSMRSINDQDITTPVRHFFNAHRLSNANELNFPRTTSATETFDPLQNVRVAIPDIGIVARNTRAKRRAYHLDNTIPSPSARRKSPKRKGRRVVSVDRTANQNGGLLENWIQSHLS